MYICIYLYAYMKKSKFSCNSIRYRHIFKCVQLLFSKSFSKEKWF